MKEKKKNCKHFRLLIMIQLPGNSPILVNHRKIYHKTSHQLQLKSF